MKKAYVIYGIASKETICELLEPQKEREEEGSRKLKETISENISNVEEICTCRLIGPQTQIDLLQDCQKPKTKTEP